jgi:hypothetical protein
MERLEKLYKETYKAWKEEKKAGYPAFCLIAFDTFLVFCWNNKLANFIFVD